MIGTGGEIGVLCVDDNPLVRDALRTLLDQTPGFRFAGALPSAEGMVEAARRDCPGLVLLDLDMPGPSPLDGLEELARECPDSRAVVVSGHVRAELIERAIQAGAWGYIAKSDVAAELPTLLAEALRGRVVFSTEARVAYNTI
jgi:DNA-binding NarL/FixJ family response regulator